MFVHMCTVHRYLLRWDSFHHIHNNVFAACGFFFQTRSNNVIIVYSGEWKIDLTWKILNTWKINFFLLFDDLYLETKCRLSTIKRLFTHNVRTYDIFLAILILSNRRLFCLNLVDVILLFLLNSSDEYFSVNWKNFWNMCGSW